MLDICKLKHENILWRIILKTLDDFLSADLDPVAENISLENSHVLFLAEGV